MTFSTDGNHRYSWIKTKRSPLVSADAACHLPPQHNQLISERGVLCLKPALRLERRSQNVPEKHNRAIIVR